MAIVSFSVEWHTGGTLVKRFDVPANACRGLMHVPDFQVMCEKLPPRLWPAVQRGSWWADKYAPSLPLRLDMVDKKGKPMGTLFATKA